MLNEDDNDGITETTLYLQARNIEIGMQVEIVAQHCNL